MERARGLQSVTVYDSTIRRALAPTEALEFFFYPPLLIYFITIYSLPHAANTSTIPLTSFSPPTRHYSNMTTMAPQHARSVALRGDNALTKAAKTTMFIIGIVFLGFFLALLARLLYKNRGSIGLRLRREWKRLVGWGSWTQSRDSDEPRVYLGNLPSGSTLSSLDPCLGLEHLPPDDTGSKQGSVEGIPVFGPFPTPSSLVAPQFFFNGDCFVGTSKPDSVHRVTSEEASDS
ncbi:hypothetical protein V8C37DRAFT_9529 [Trichoderma ceciliae]